MVTFKQGLKGVGVCHVEQRKEGHSAEGNNKYNTQIPRDN